MSDAEQVGARVFEEGLNLTVSSENNSQDSEGFEGGFSQEEDSDWNIDKGKKKGIVHFLSTPSGATVMMNGKLVCPTTPCKKSLPLGRNNINIQKERYSPWKQKVTLSKGKKIKAKLKPTFGYLVISAPVSGVSLYMDGKKIGQTPLPTLEVDPGKHSITVKDKCYKGPEYKFKSKAGKTEQINKYPIRCNVFNDPF